MPVDQTAADDKQKTKKKKSHFIPWSKSTAVIKFSFHGDNPLSTFLDNAWGSVQIPISDLVGEELKNDETEEIPGVQEEVRVWKDIVWTSAHLQVILYEVLLISASDFERCRKKKIFMSRTLEIWIILMPCLHRKREEK